MCYKISAAEERHLKAILQEQGFEVIIDQQYYFADGYDFPHIPITTDRHRNKVAPMQWGLLPEWVNLKSLRNKYLEEQTVKFIKVGKPFDPSLVVMPSDDKLLQGFQANTLNARAEDIFTKPSWRNSIMSKRCIIYVDGFFEHKHYDNGKVKIPYYVYPQDKSVLRLGGIWSEWTNAETGEVRETFAIVTVDANTMMSEIHNSKKRMPLVFTDAEGDRWLSQDATKEEIIQLMRPCAENLLAAHTVSKTIAKTDVVRNIPSIREQINYFPEAMTNALLF